MTENKNKKSGAFRHKKVYFTQVSNDVLRTSNLSLGAKGLYALIQSYVTIEGFTLYKSTLLKDCQEGQGAFDSRWKELKEEGFLVQYKLKDENNNFYYEYDLLDIPIKNNNNNNDNDNDSTENPVVPTVSDDDNNNHLDENPPVDNGENEVKNGDNLPNSPQVVNCESGIKNDTKNTSKENKESEENPVVPMGEGDNNSDHLPKNPLVESVRHGSLRSGSLRSGNQGGYNNTNLNNTYSMYVCTYEQHLIATKTFKDFLAKNEIYRIMDLDLFELILVEVMNNNRVKKKDRYFLKTIKEIANKGIRTVADYEASLEDYKKKNYKTKSENKTNSKSYEKEIPKVKTRFHSVNSKIDKYSAEELEETILVSQSQKFGDDCLGKLYFKAINNGLNSLLTEGGKIVVVEYAKKRNLEIPK